MKNSSIFPKPLYWIFVVAIFLGAFALRMVDIDDLPLDFHPTRQLYSALKARGLYYYGSETLPYWQRQMSNYQLKLQGTIEPEVIERITLFAYQRAGEANFVIPRVFSILYWLVSSVFLWLTARRLVSDDGALFTTAVYLFLPYGVFASRSFQPEPLMMMFFAIFLWTLVRWDTAKKTNQNTWGWALLTGLFGGAAIFIKMTIVFLVFGALAGAFLNLRALKKTFINPQLWIATALTLLPTVTYLVYGIFINGFLAQQVNGRFFPDMLLQPSFYLRWGLKLEFVVGYGILALTLLGIFLFPDKKRRIILGLLAGYLAFGLYFNYHFSTHDYYQIPFILIAALAIAPLADALKTALQTHSPQKWTPQLALTLGLATAILGSAWHTRSTLLATDYRPLATVYAEIGDTLRDQGKVIALAEDYGNRLDYWGWFYAANFPSMGDLWYHEKRGSDKNIDNLIKKHIKDYDFFLVTDFDEWALQDDLRAYLTENYPLFVEDEDYLIFDLRIP